MVAQAFDPEAVHLLSQTPIWDCHVHLGRDRDGNSLALPHLVEELRRNHIRRAVAFPFDDRDDQSFHEPNERIHEAAAQYPHQIIPFFRLNPTRAWKEEARLRASQGFRGIKLHPRAQTFSLLSSSAKQIYRFAERSKLPILIHTGLGTERIATQAARIAREFPNLTLILGHAGFVDLGGVISLLRTRQARNIYVETSTLKIYDLYDLLSVCDPRKILFGSDIPYADIEVGLAGLVDCAIMLGHSESNIQRMLGSNLMRCLGEKP